MTDNCATRTARGEATPAHGGATAANAASDERTTANFVAAAQGRFFFLILISRNGVSDIVGDI